MYHMELFLLWPKITRWEQWDWTKTFNLWARQPKQELNNANCSVELKGTAESVGSLLQMNPAFAVRHILSISRIICNNHHSFLTHVRRQLLSVASQAMQLFFMAWHWPHNHTGNNAKWACHGERWSEAARPQSAQTRKLRSPVFFTLNPCLLG